MLDTADRDPVLGPDRIDALGDTTLRDYGSYTVVAGDLVFDEVTSP